MGPVTNVVLFDKEPSGVASVRYSNTEAAEDCVKVCSDFQVSSFSIVNPWILCQGCLLFMLAHSFPTVFTERGLIYCTAIYITDSPIESTGHAWTALLWDGS